MKNPNHNKNREAQKILAQRLYACLVHELGHWFFDHLIQKEYGDIALVVHFSHSPETGLPGLIGGKTTMPMESIPWRDEPKKEKLSYASGYAAQKLLGVTLSLDKGPHGDLAIFKSEEELNEWIKKTIEILSPYKGNIQMAATKLTDELRKKKDGEYHFEDRDIKKVSNITKLP